MMPPLSNNKSSSTDFGNNHNHNPNKEDAETIIRTLQAKTQRQLAELQLGEEMLSDAEAIISELEMEAEVQHVEIQRLRDVECQFRREERRRRNEVGEKEDVRRQLWCWMETELQRLLQKSRDRRVR